LEPKPTAEQVIFVLGGPGSGKGTQCALLAERHAFAHFSAGDLLREEVASGSEHGQMIQALMTEGKIVPAQVTIDLLSKAMGTRPGPYLIDGFPRSMDNATAFEEQVAARATPRSAGTWSGSCPASSWLTKPAPPCTRSRRAPARHPPPSHLPPSHNPSLPVAVCS
jgi:hypothetical protein